MAYIGPPPAFTTAQRDAIPAGSRPPYMQIYNTSTGQLEVNIGSDATPAWAAIGDPIGTVKAFAGSTAPTGWLLCDGSAVSRTTYANLYAVISTTYGTGDGSTTFNLPDAQGRAIYGKAGVGGHADVTTLGASDGLALANRSPKHNSTNGLTLPNHAHSDTISFSDSGHTHTYSGTTGTDSPDHTHSEQYRPDAGNSAGTFNAVGPGGLTSGASGGASARHTHTFSGTSATGTSSLSKTGSVGNPSTNPAISGSIGPGGTRPTDTGGYLVLNHIIRY